MAMCMRLVRPSPRILQRNPLPISLLNKQRFTTITCTQQYYQGKGQSLYQRPSKRTIAQSAQPGITGQEAPSAQAYISSGVLAGRKNLVDVKKVLVIGSGGLSIGQAGEFDYSGKINNRLCHYGRLHVTRIPLARSIMRLSMNWTNWKIICQLYRFSSAQSLKGSKGCIHTD